MTVENTSCPLAELALVQCQKGRAERSSYILYQIAVKLSYSFVLLVIVLSDNRCPVQGNISLNSASETEAKSSNEHKYNIRVV